MARSPIPLPEFTGDDIAVRVDEHSVAVTALETRAADLEAASVPGADSVAALLADTSIAYTNVSAGDFVRGGEHFYEVVGQGETDYHLATAGGVKAKVMPEAAGFNVKAFGARGDGTTNDTAAFNAALALGRPVYAPAGTYRVNVTSLASGAHLCGEGESTVIKPYNVATTAISAASAGATSWIEGVTIRNLKLQGTVTTDGFSEFVHLLDLRGVTRLRVENVVFEGFRGDGFYLGGNNGATQYSNRDVIVRGCAFDGLNNQNRNGLSVIDADGMLVEGCTFRNCARSTMPGSLDFEPNNSTQQIKNVRVIGNQFVNTDGNRGHVCLQTQNTQNVENIVIKGNHFEDANTAGAVTLSLHTSVPTAPQRIIIADNTAEVSGASFVWKLDGCTDGVTIKGNVASGLRGVWFSKIGATKTDRNTLITDNEFFIENAGFGVLLGETTSYAAIRGNLISGTPTAHLQLGGNGDTDHISITDNDFVGTPTSRVISHAPPTSHGELTNVLQGNRFEPGHTHLFRATRCDFVGGQSNVYGFTTLPSAFAPGEHLARTSLGTGPSGVSNTGTLKTIVPTATVTDTYQIYTPQYSASDTLKSFRRQAVDASTWGAWATFTGA